MEPKGFEIPGIRITYPDTVSGAVVGVAVIIGFVCITIIAAWTFRHADPSTVQALVGQWSRYELSENLEREIDDSYIIQFWTPSPETSAYDVQNWERDVTEERVVEFGHLLTGKPEVVGYRRWNVFGHGRTTYKEGYWWVITVSSDFQLSDFEKTYRSFWETEGSIYVETIRRSGTYTPAAPNVVH